MGQFASHIGRYDTSGNSEDQYIDDARTVLVNRPGLTDLRALQVREEESLARAYERLLTEVRTDTPLTCALLCHIHHRIFADLYDWAGRYRTVWISKAGFTWPPPDFLAAQMDLFEKIVLSRLSPAGLADDQAFCAAVAEIQGEFLSIHPFREGNARTIKLATDLLAAQTGRPLLRYDQTDAGRDRYIAAAKAAIGRHFRLMEGVIREALAAARRP